MSNYGEAIKARRRSWKENQGQLAKAIGVSGALISMIEKGERTLSLDIAFKIAEHYRISVEELLFRSDVGEHCDQPTAVFTLEAIKEFSKIICPIIRSDVADSNQEFKLVVSFLFPHCTDSYNKNPSSPQCWNGRGRGEAKKIPRIRYGGAIQAHVTSNPVICRCSAFLDLHQSVPRFDTHVQTMNPIIVCTP